MFWQGGFMFYGGVVVPVGSDVLNSHRLQGFITQSVTNYLNLAGAACLAVWFWDVAVEQGSVRWHRRLLWSLWSLLVLALCLQVWIHSHMDELLDVESFRILDSTRYRFLHMCYLFISTLQWLGAIALTALSLRIWQEGGSVPKGAPNQVL